MALPTYDRLCQASGAENNVALVALCAGTQPMESHIWAAVDVKYRHHTGPYYF